MVKSNGNGNGSTPPKPWGQIKCVPVDELPPQRHTLWYELYSDLMLRLDETPLDEALVVPFADQVTADLARNAIVRYAVARKGEKAVLTRMIKTPDAVLVYVYRGPNYK